MRSGFTDLGSSCSALNFASYRNNTRCITQSLYGIQNATGQNIDINFLTGLLGVGGGNTSVTDLATLDSNVICTGCNKA